MKFKTPFNKKDFKSTMEIGSGERKVETAGFIDVRTRINNMMLAGQRLIQSRKEMYDFEGEVDEDFIDPTRNHGYDMADASQELLRMERDIKASQKAAKESVSDSIKEKGTEVPNTEPAPPKGA